MTKPLCVAILGAGRFGREAHLGNLIQMGDVRVMAVQHRLSRFYKVPLEQIVVVHDELDIPFGQLRLKVGGGEGGHNGLRSISPSLSTKEYVRLRFGIGRPPGRQDPADFVLTDFSSVERKELEFLVDRAADAVEIVVSKGLAAAQQVYHTA